MSLPVREPKPGKVTDETVRSLEEAGLHDLAEVARKYVKRPGRVRVLGARVWVHVFGRWRGFP